MEGQMNKVDQLYSSNDGSSGNVAARSNVTGSNNLKQRLTAPIVPSDNHLPQQTPYGSKYSYDAGPFAPIGDHQLLNGGLDLEHQRQLLTSGAHYGQHPGPLVMQQQLNRTNTIAGDHYDQTYNSGHPNTAALQKQSQLIGASNPSLNANIRLLQQQQSGEQQERSMSVYGSRSKVSDFNSHSSLRKSVPISGRDQSSLHGSTRLAQVYSSSSGGGVVARTMVPIDSLDSDQQLAQYSQGSPQTQQLLDQLAQQQRQQAYRTSMNMYNDSQDSSSCRTTRGAGNYMLNQPRASSMSQNQSLSSMVPKITDTDQQQMFLESQQQQPENHTQRRALTLSTMHRPFLNNQLIYGNKQQTIQQRNLPPGIYGMQQGQTSSLAGNNLSSSITCCNAANEAPLISDLVKRANLQQQQQQQVNSRLMQMAHANNAMRMQQQISDAAPTTATIPRSLSAYQLSKSQLRLNQQQQLQRQHQQLLQQQRHQVQSAYVKSMSDAGQVNKHQPPNHSLSYPHACSGHSGDPGNSMGTNDSPALPPPPPPPSLMPHQVGLGQASCATLPPQMSDNKRQAFKVSRLDPSQLTGDTLPDSDLVMTNMPLGSMQFDDVSTESDATFGMLIDSVGNASLNFGPQVNRQASSMAPNQQSQHPLLLSQSYKTIQPIPHLSECNLIRHQRAEALASEGGSIGRQQMLMSQSSCICDCGALERGNQLRQHQEHALLSQHFAPPLSQQQRQLVQSDTRDYDMDSEEAKAMQRAPYGFIGDMDGNNNIVMTAQLRSNRQIMHMNHENIHNYNGSTHGNPANLQQQMRLDRFRQQSSQMTADDDEDVEDDDEDDQNGIDGFVGNNLGRQVEIDDDEISSDVAAGQRRRAEAQRSAFKVNTVMGTPKSIVRRNEEELRDVEGIGLRQKHLSGSHTSICTCGSQAKLDMNDLVDDDDDDDNDYRDVASLNDQKVSSTQTTVKSQSAVSNETNMLPSKQSDTVDEIPTKQTSVKEDLNLSNRSKPT